jgi:tetratricopeptide (TPR) repeat protein
MNVMDGRQRRATFYADLGVSRDASQKEVETAFWRRREMWRRGQESEDNLRKAEQAYLTLSDPRRRLSYDRLLGVSRHPAWADDRPPRRVSARRLFRRCRSLMKRGDHRGALKLARRAAALDPGCALYWSALGLLVARSGGCLREAIRHCQRGHELEPAERRVALNLATLYEKAGLRKRALKLRRDHGWSLPDIFQSGL